MKYLLMMILSVCLLACIEQEDSFIQSPNIESVKLLGHKGSGTFQSLGNGYRDNSIEAVLNAFNLVDGAEVDIQMSKDSVLLLFHDANFENCEGLLANVFDYNYLELIEMKNCNGLSFSSLKELIEIHNRSEFKNKYLSLDLKVLLNDAVLEAFGGEELLSKFISNRIKDWGSGSIRNKLLIETPSEVSYLMFDQAGFISYLVNPSPTQTNLNVSFNFKDENQHSNTSRKQTWVLNEWEDFYKTVVQKVDFIQSDNLAMLSFINGLSDKEIRTQKIFEGEIKGSPEFYPLLDNYILTKNELLDLKAFEKPGVFLVVSENNENENRFWKAYELSKNEFTIYSSSRFLKDKKSRVNIFIWNPNKMNIESKKLRLFTSNF